MLIPNRRARANLHLRGAAIETTHAQLPQIIVQAGVIGVAEEWLGVGADSPRIQEGDDSDLVVPTDRGDDCGDLRVSESCVDVADTILRGSTQLAGGGILDGLESQVTKPAHSLFVNVRESARGRETWRQYSDFHATRS